MSLNAYTFANVGASQTDAVLIAAIQNRIIIVKAVACLSGGTSTTITFNSKGTGSGTAISCAFANGASGGFVLPEADGGWFQTNPGEALTCTTGGGSTTGIQLVYTFYGVPGV